MKRLKSNMKRLKSKLKYILCEISIVIVIFLIICAAALVDMRSSREYSANSITVNEMYLSIQQSQNEIQNLKNMV